MAAVGQASRQNGQNQLSKIFGDVSYLMHSFSSTIQGTAQPATQRHVALTT